MAHLQRRPRVLKIREIEAFVLRAGTQVRHAAKLWRVRGYKTMILQSERRLSHQLPFRVCRLEAGLGGNTQVELASTRHREGPYVPIRVEPSQGCLPKPQAVA
jgi:hypothetical protein